jgi:2C-methyl-D-erythritol 2,4-cyclodiphosphate synthase
MPAGAGAQGGKVILSVSDRTPCYECATAVRHTLERVGEAVSRERDYGVGRLVSEVAWSVDIHHVASAAVKAGLALLLSAESGQNLHPMKMQRRNIMQQIPDSKTEGVIMNRRKHIVFHTILTFFFSGVLCMGGGLSTSPLEAATVTVTRYRFDYRSGIHEVTFTPPRYEGYRLDICLQWGKECGAPAATAWCKFQGYEKSSSYKIEYDIGQRDPTKVFVGGTVCAEAFCDAFSEVTCESKSESLAQKNNEIVDEIERLKKENDRLFAAIKPNLASQIKAEELNKLVGQILWSLWALPYTYQALAQELRTANERHRAWLADFHARQRDDMARWERLKTLTSYAELLPEIAQSEKRIPNDASLLAQENALRQRLDSKTGNTLAHQINTLLATAVLEDILGKVPPETPHELSGWSRLSFLYQHKSLANQVRKALTNAVPELKQLDLTLSTQRTRLEQYASIRRQLQEAWRRQLRQVTAALPSHIQRLISDASNEIATLLHDSASPKLALRKVRGFGVLLEDLEQNLSEAKLPPDDPLTTQVYREVATGWSVYNDHKAMIEGLSDGDLEAYAITRAAMAEAAIGRAMHVSERCKALLDEIVMRGTDVQDEIHYGEVQSCIE